MVSLDVATCCACAVNAHNSSAAPAVAVMAMPWRANWGWDVFFTCVS
jgi:hypothetical protein